MIDQLQFLEIARRLLVEARQYAVAQMDRRPIVNTVEWYINNWTISSTIPKGDDVPAYSAWAILASREQQVTNVADFMVTIDARKQSTVAAILVDPQQLESFHVLLRVDGTLVAVEQIRFIGPGLLTLPDNSVDVAIEEASRASRTRGALGAPLLARLRGLSVAVVGLGRGGWLPTYACSFQDADARSVFRRWTRRRWSVSFTFFRNPRGVSSPVRDQNGITSELEVFFTSMLLLPPWQ